MRVEMSTIRVNSPVFKGSDRRRIDVQGHTGKMHDGMKNQDYIYTGQNIIDTVSDTGVKKVLVSSLSGLNPKESNLYLDEIAANEELIKECKASGGKLFPLATCQPGISTSTENIEKIITKDKFYGMKFHPSNSGKSIKDNFDIYSKYLDVAEKHELPCVFHSVTDGKADPLEIIKLAEKHKKLPVVLYHIDLGSSKEQFEKTLNAIAESVDAKKSNIFVDLSWLTDIWADNTQKNKDIIKMSIDKLGAERVMFGSDTPITEMGNKELYGKFVDFVENTTKEFFKEKNNEGASEKALNRIFYDNAEEVFFTKNWAKKGISKASKVAGICFAGAALIAGGGYLIHKKMKHKKAEEELKANPSRVIKNPNLSLVV